jgi:hypothetical protein
MSKADEYRRQALLAQKAADGASNDHDRAAWLQIARDWLALLHTRSVDDAFDVEVKGPGTGQDGSDAPN